jgi:hypothetical protein
VGGAVEEHHFGLLVIPIAGYLAAHGSHRP